MKRILIVDDEPNIRNLVTAYLRAENYLVDCAGDGLEALRLFRDYQPDLVILDILLPGMDGLELLDIIRCESDVYVLMLTAKSEEYDRVLGLTTGADDYLTKPFSPRELVARVQAILRRGRGGQCESLLEYKHIQIDSQRHEVHCNGELIEMTAREFKLLKMLANHVGMVLSREHLIEHVWGHDYYGDDPVVDVHIGRIRQKLEADSSQPQFIHTIRGVGYKFEDERL
jgi:two-component system alkaline phosphatase synthesis response regulator PhoP